MKFKSLVTLIFTVCLAVIANNAMAKSDKSGKSDKSAKHSEKSDKSAKSGRSDKSGKRGKGLGHCKSDKSGKGHSKKRGKGHRDRDCNCNEEPLPVCVAVASDVTETLLLEGRPGSFTASITFEGPVCEIGDEADYHESIITDEGFTICSLESSTLSGQIVNPAGTEFHYDAEVVLACERTPISS